MPAQDRGLAYGDGVFRTFTAIHGNCRHWRRQYLKLTLDCARIRIAPPDEGELHRDVAQVAADASACVVRITVTRGPAARGYRYSAAATLTRIVVSGPLPVYPEAWSKSGVEARTCKLRLARQPVLAGVKHLNRLENVMARAEWNDDAIAEGLLYDTADRVIGGTMTNVFLVRDGTLETPDLTQCGVAGATRDRVIEAAYRHDLPCTIRDMTMADVRSADEVFLVNSVIGVWPVRALDGDALEVGPVTRKMREWLEQDSDADVV